MKKEIPDTKSLEEVGPSIVVLAVVVLLELQDELAIFGVDLRLHVC